MKQKINDNEIKMKKPTKITQTQKEKMIENMFNKQACTIGIAPLSNDHVSRVCNDLTKKGVLDRTEPLKTRQERTLKSLVKSWCVKHLSVTEDEWDQIKVKKISQTNSETSDVVYISMETIDDITILTSKAKNLSNKN